MQDFLHPHLGSSWYGSEQQWSWHAVATHATGMRLRTISRSLLSSLCVAMLIRNRRPALSPWMRRTSSSVMGSRRACWRLVASFSAICSKLTARSCKDPLFSIKQSMSSLFLESSRIAACRSLGSYTPGN